MDPLHIVLILLAIAAIWAVAELAVTLRRARGTVESVDRTLGELDRTLAEARPVMAKLDDALDELQPALGQVEPLLKQGSIAVEALSADLIEVNGVLRDVSAVTSDMQTATGAVSGIASAATEKVSRLLGRRGPAPQDRALDDRTSGADDAEEPEGLEGDAAEVPEVPVADPAPERGYYTYGAAAGAPSDTESGSSHE